MFTGATRIHQVDLRTAADWTAISQVQLINLCIHQLVPSFSLGGGGGVCYDQHRKYSRFSGLHSTYTLQTKLILLHRLGKLLIAAKWSLLNIKHIIFSCLTLCNLAHHRFH